MALGYSWAEMSRNKKQANVGVQARPEAVACNDGLGVAARKMPYVGCKKQKYAGDRGDG